MQSDPVGLTASLNTFAYAGGNALAWRDGFGLAACAPGDVMCDIAMRNAGLPVPDCPCDKLPKFNPAKIVTSFGNAALSGASAASGGLKIAVGAGLTATGAGAAPGAGLFAWAAWSLHSSMAAWQRSRKEWTEAMKETWCDANWKNMYGLLPGGTHYDDPNEPGGPIQYIRTRGIWKFMAEMGFL